MSNPQPSQEGDASLADTNSRGTRIYYPQGLRYKVHIIQILPTILAIIRTTPLELLTARYVWLKYESLFGSLQSAIKRGKLKGLIIRLCEKQRNRLIKEEEELNSMKKGKPKTFVAEELQKRQREITAQRDRRRKVLCARLESKLAALDRKHLIWLRMEFKYYAFLEKIRKQRKERKTKAKT